MKDDALKSVREARHLISESIQHNPRNLVDYYKNLQSKHKDRVISERPVLSSAENKEAA